MSEEELLSMIALMKVEGVGPVIAKNLIAYCGGVREVFGKPVGFLRKVPEVGSKVIDELKKGVSFVAAEKEMRFCQDNDIAVLPYTHARYPEPLKSIHNSPLILFQKGELNLNEYPAVAIVGTRKATEYGREQTRRFADYFVSQGVNVVSGLAYGIDITAHKAVLEAEGITTAVLGHGLHTIYPPQHATTAREIIDKGGALITEYLSHIFPDGNNFPARNRIIAGMSMATVVIEASEKGGALITGKIAFDQNREVFAVPGNLTAKYSEGCNILIRDQIAQLVTSPEEVIEALKLQTPVKKAGAKKELKADLFTPITSPLSAEEQQVLNILEQGETLLDQLADKTRIPLANLMPLLLTLEFKGLVRQTPGRKFSRC